MIEIAVAHGIAEPVEATRKCVRERKGDRDHAINQRHFRQQPAAQISEAGEQCPDAQKLDRCDQQMAKRLKDEVGAVLELPAQRDREIAKIKSERIEHHDDFQLL